MFQNTHLSWFPFLNDASDFLQKLFTRAVLAILESENSKKILGTSTPTMVGSLLDTILFGLFTLYDWWLRHCL